MLREIRKTRNGIVYQKNGLPVYLDPKYGKNDGISFVSHAHVDHLHNQKNGLVLTTKQTSEIARIRGYDISNFVENYEDFAMIDTGHILGARGLVLDNTVYTGDICTRDRAFMQGAKIPKCKTLIMECTFGLPEFVFPKIDDVVSEVNTLISELYSKGKPVVLLGYELGKAQILSHLFSHWEPIYYHDSVKKINDLYRVFGINLKDAPSYSEAESRGLLEKRPWIMIAPSLSSKSKFVNYVKSKYEAITMGFSGWSQSKKFPFTKQHDYSFVLSDHCDYDELIELVNKSSPEKVYTVHGFTDEFARDLTDLGFDAQSLKEESLDDFCY